MQTTRTASAILLALSLSACATGGQFDQYRAKILNNFQDTELKISPELTKQAKIENARIYSAGMTINVGLDIIYPKTCSMLTVVGGFYTKDGTKVSSLNGSVFTYNAREKAHLVINPTNTAPLLNMQEAIAVATLDRAECAGS
ncbi:hypothetical protein SAMN05216319_0258 [Duganella sp. CF402]|uniref:hypothetical protein n=1 Tax=unclassified Duganella TaxID=2636909 RepID=UPI0008C3F250|nr:MULTISPECIES: hypothetical protein [unclassified Duganella]RZT11261.1 hypothetical protein EV582_3368 [Duganella sp. BK701]SEK73768.1 hypothetical protein SAMN05216319_0258 [Duganella sp. CF402]